MSVLRFVVPVLLSSLCVVPAAAGEADDLRTVFAQWAARRDGRTLSAAAAGRATKPVGSLNDMRDLLPGNVPTDVPAEDHTYDERLELLLDPARGRARIGVTGEMFNTWEDGFGFLPHAQVNLWDGAGWQIHCPRQGHEFGGADGGSADLTFGTTPYAPLSVNIALFPLLFQVGSFHADPMGERFDPGPPPAAPEYRSAGYTERDGRRLLVVRTRPEGRGRRYFEYWADPRRDGEVVHVSQHYDHGPRFAVEIEHEDAADGRRRPARWTVTWFDAGNGVDVNSTEQFELERLEFGAAVEPADFRMEPEVGWWIIDHDASGGASSVSYVYEGPDEPPSTVRAAHDARDAKAGWPMTLAIAAAAALGAGVAFIFYRRHRSGGA